MRRVLILTVAVCLSNALHADDVPLQNWPVSFHARATREAGGPGFVASPQFVPPARGYFVPVTPCRVLDTRLADGPFGGPMFAAGETRSYSIPDGPCPAIPGALAYSLNFTIVNYSGRAAIKAYPTGATPPITSILNYGAGLPVANGALVPADDKGSIDVNVSLTSNPGPTNLVIDINGYVLDGVVTDVIAGTGLSGGGTGSIGIGIAPGGVTGTEIHDNAVVRSINGVQDAVTLAAGNQIAITPSGTTLTIAANSTAANNANTLVQRDATGGFAAGALTLSGKIDQTSSSGFVAKGGTVGPIPATGSGRRMMWYPALAAFRAGIVDGTQWDAASTGLSSFAGGSNTIASGLHSTAFGETTSATGDTSFAVGYHSVANNTDSVAMGGNATANALGSIAMGEDVTASGTSSVVLGSHAASESSDAVPVAYSGSFVFGDSSTTTILRPTAIHQFIVRAIGGAKFFTNSALTTGVILAAGGGSWASVSDRNRKEEFRDVDDAEILHKLEALPVTSWKYKDDDTGNRYIGPMAQDFHALFALGTDTTIATMDVDGVTLAAVKALAANDSALKAENAKLRGQIEDLLRRVESVEEQLQKR